MAKPTNLSRDARKGHVLKPIECFDMETQTDPWECPFCVPPVYTIKLPSKESQFLMESFRRQISEHLQIHKQDVIKAIAEREKRKAAKV
ncbi:hypothetical protein BDA99DRAFT_64920 [Phascolomyces articulosus]|uniref:Uncharacterized protein n=1 Tax=Phascolomyces articulosus TaxID=60185 RepID=A0AAD5KDS7_9FUNG|nr:hypothetical protein BDA99DRAFT_64920 [Phascolomyces articulosus]